MIRREGLRSRGPSRSWLSRSFASSTCILKTTMKWFLSSLPAAAVLALAGCGGADGDAGRVDVYAVSGKVTFAGAPVPEATVTFSPTGQQPVALGRTDAQGNYVMTTYDSGDGAAAGDYKVLVMKAAAAAGASGPVGHDAYSAGAASSHSASSSGAGAGSALPAQYSAVDKTPLTATVKTEGENTIDFALTP